MDCFQRKIVHTCIRKLKRCSDHNSTTTHTHTTNCILCACRIVLVFSYFLILSHIHFLFFLPHPFVRALHIYINVCVCSCPFVSNSGAQTGRDPLFQVQCCSVHNEIGACDCSVCSALFRVFPQCHACVCLYMCECDCIMRVFFSLADFIWGALEFRMANSILFEWHKYICTVHTYMYMYISPFIILLHFF